LRGGISRLPPAGKKSKIASAATRMKKGFASKIRVENFCGELNQNLIFRIVFSKHSGAIDAVGTGHVVSRPTNVSPGRLAGSPQYLKKSKGILGNRRWGPKLWEPRASACGPTTTRFANCSQKKQLVIDLSGPRLGNHWLPTISQEGLMDHGGCKVFSLLAIFFGILIFIGGNCGWEKNAQ